MKKLFILILLVFSSVISLPAVTMTSVGADVAYSTISGNVEMGIFTKTTAGGSISGGKSSLGLATRSDITFSLPKAEYLSVGAIVGIGGDYWINDRSAINFTLGPSVFISSRIKDDENYPIGVGGGVDLSYSFYFDDWKSMALETGMVNYFIASIYESRDTEFNYYGSFYFSMIFRFGDSSPAYLPYYYY